MRLAAPTFHTIGRIVQMHRKPKMAVAGCAALLLLAACGNSASNYGGQ